MIAIVDVQGFKNEQNQFIPKEIAVLCDRRVYVLLIKPPYPFYDLTKKERLQVAWLEKNRGLLWNEGITPYFNYKNQLCDFLSNKCILTKGCEKVIWLKEMFDNNITVYNLEDRNCPSLVTLYDQYSSSSNILSCVYHEKICALKNVFCLNMWCRENGILNTVSM